MARAVAGESFAEKRKKCGKTAEISPAARWAGAGGCRPWRTVVRSTLSRSDQEVGA